MNQIVHIVVYKGTALLLDGRGDIWRVRASAHRPIVEMVGERQKFEVGESARIVEAAMCAAADKADLT